MFSLRLTPPFPVVPHPPLMLLTHRTSAFQPACLLAARKPRAPPHTASLNVCARLWRSRVLLFSLRVRFFVTIHCSQQSLHYDSRLDSCCTVASTRTPYVLVWRTPVDRRNLDDTVAADRRGGVSQCRQTSRHGYVMAIESHISFYNRRHEQCCFSSLWFSISTIGFINS